MPSTDDANDEAESWEALVGYVCTALDAFGHRAKWTAPVRAPAKPDLANEEATRQERRRLLANNKAWRSAEAYMRALGATS